MPTFRAVPWMMVLEVARVAGKALRDIDPADKARAADIARRTKGLPHHVTPQERADLMRIARSIDVRKLAGDLAPRGTRRIIRGRGK